MLAAGALLAFGVKAADSTNLVAEFSWLTLTNRSPELELSGTPLTYALLNCPGGAAVDTNGVITWQPTEAQGPGTNFFLGTISDGTNSVTNSFTVFVTEENEPPVAANDSYTVSNATLTISAPGVLTNDTDADLPANELWVALVAGPTNGTLNLSSNGGFLYTPTAGFSGVDGFTYCVHDGPSNSSPATVALSVLPRGFRITSVTRSGSTATVTWESEDGKNYRVFYKDDATGGDWNVLTGDVAAMTPATNKTDFLADGGQRFYRVQLLTNSAPVLPAQDDRIIPELSTLSVTNTATDADMPGESLVYALAEAPTNAVISAEGVVSWTPTEADGPGTNMFTTIVTDNGGLTATNRFTVIVTETNLAPVFFQTPPDITVAEHGSLNLTNLATDADEPANVLTYSLLDAPAGATVNTGGVITWSPGEEQGPGTNVITTVVSDGIDSVTNQFVVVVTEENSPPTLPALPDVAATEKAMLTVTNTATDLDVPVNVLSYSLTESPQGAAMDANGIITWTPDESQGGSTNIFTTVVTDGDGLSATNRFAVIVLEQNSAPQLPMQTNFLMAELTMFTVTNTASDLDEPLNVLTYFLASAPTNAVISPDGVITWTPSESQGPGTNEFTTVATDEGGLSATNSFFVVVTEVNVAPELPTRGNLAALENVSLTVTNTATDADEPVNALTYSLIESPAGAAVDMNGVITWTPNEAEGPGTNTFTTVATDSGGLSATNFFVVIVTEENSPPSLAAQSQKIIAELSTLTVTNVATDSDQPTNVLSYALTVAPTNAQISTAGVITWAPTEVQGPTTNIFTTVATDGDLSATNSFTVVVTEVNLAPVAGNNAYAVTGPLSISAPGILANDTDADLPANILTAVFASGPTNGNLTLTNNGGFAYTPNPGFSGTDAFTYRANDGQSNSAPATVTLTVTAAPYITGQPNGQTVAVGTNVSFFVAASGTAPLSYQWRKGGTNLPGATVSALSLLNVQTNDAGNYQAVITNVVGAVTSAVASLTVNVPEGNCLSAPLGMLGWWPGDGNADDFFSINHGTLVGGGTAGGAGKVGAAFTFNGTNNYVSIPDSPALRPTNFTIEAWVKFDGLDSAGNASAGQQYIVFKQNTRSSLFEGFYLGKERSGNNNFFSFGVTPATGSGANVDGTTLISTGVWYHVAAVRSPTTIQLFVNGAFQAQASANFAQDYGNYPLYFGTSGQPGWDRKFKGVLDEVTIYNRPLASNEIVAIHAAGAGGKCKGPSAPSIITQPANKIYVAGGSTSFSVVAAGTEPLSYQWFRDGFPMVNDARISGANGSVLSLTAMQASDIGNYHVSVSNNLGTATSATASLNTGAPPANDNFSSAVSISGTSGTANGNNANATRQAGEPNHAGNSGPSSVWYNWTAPSASPVTFDTTWSAFDTLLGVYTGNNVNNLTLVATNNNISTNDSRSRVTFTPVAGTIYRIAVDGDDGANGNLTLRWVQASVALPDLVIFNSAVNPYVTTETFSANSCAVMEGLVPAGTRKIIRFDTQTANQGAANLVFGNPATNPSFVYAPCHAHYHFQNYMSYRLRYANGEIAAVGLKVGFCVLDVFRWDNGAPNNALYDCNNQGIQKGWGDLYDSTLDGQWIDITGLPDGNYIIEMEANPLGMILESNYGNNLTTVPVSVGNSSAPPLNNNFGSAQTLLGTSPSVAGANANATKESGEPDHAGNAGGKSIWYNWTAPSTKVVTIDTIGSGFNTLLGVYTGSAVNGLTLVTNNDDILPGSVLQSRVTFNATAGTLYRIAVDGFGGASSNVIITVNQTVANDAYNACIFTGGVLGFMSGSTVGATKEASEPNHAGNAGGHSTWYCWTAPVGGTVTFDTEGSTFNTLLGVYTGSSVSALTFIAGNDDDGATQQSRVSFNAVGLTMYHIVIDGFNGDSGNTMLNWHLSVAAPSSALLASLAMNPNTGQSTVNGQAVLSFNVLPEGMFQLGISGPPQQRYRIERSCDLQTWVPLVNTVADFNGKAWFTDKAARHLRTGSGDAVCGSGQILGVAVSPTEARFYRAVALPAN